MARVKYKRQRVKRVRPPKAIAPPKLPRPKRTALKNIYKDLLSSDIDQRITTLAKSATWYDHCAAYIRHKQDGEWTIPQLRDENAANRSRTQAITTTDSKKKEEYFINTIQSYESLVADFKPPLLKNYLLKLKQTRPKLEARKKRLKNKYGEFLELLQKVTKPKNAKGTLAGFKVDKLRSEFRVSIEGDITFDRRAINDMRKLARQKGLLSVLIAIAPILTEPYARFAEKDPKGHLTGRTMVSFKKKYISLLDIISNLNHYALTEEKPRKIVRRIRPKKVKVTE